MSSRGMWNGSRAAWATGCDWFDRNEPPPDLGRFNCAGRYVCYDMDATAKAEERAREAALRRAFDVLHASEVLPQAPDGFEWRRDDGDWDLCAVGIQDEPRWKAGGYVSFEHGHWDAYGWCKHHGEYDTLREAAEALIAAVVGAGAKPSDEDEDDGLPAMAEGSAWCRHGFVSTSRDMVRISIGGSLRLATETMLIDAPVPDVRHAIARSDRERSQHPRDRLLGLVAELREESKEHDSNSHDITSRTDAERSLEWGMCCAKLDATNRLLKLDDEMREVGVW